MRHLHQWRFVVLGLLFSGPASAQVVWDTKNFAPPKPNYGTTDNQPRPDVWPRLDRGAVVCKTEADLNLLAASRRGEAVARPNCSIVRAPTAVKIVQRMGPGKTQVTVTDQGDQPGWTDAWLPDRAPPPPTGKATIVK